MRALQYIKNQSLPKQPLFLKAIVGTILGFIAIRYASLFGIYESETPQQDSSQDRDVPFIGWI